MRRSSKRISFALDAGLLKEAVRLSGEKTYSRTVERALEELVQKCRAGRILELAGSGLWQGTLSDMRGDSSKKRRQLLARRPRL